jgi:hypothetical protein
MLAGLALTIFGLQYFYFGCLAQILYDYSGRPTRRWLRIFRYTQSVITSGIVFAAGIVCTIPLLTEYWRFGLRLRPDLMLPSHLAVFGLLLISIASMTFTFTLLLHATAIYIKPKLPRRDET